MQLATGTKRKVTKYVRKCPFEMNGTNTFVDLNITHLVSYDVLIGMDWLDAHHAILDYHRKTYTCLDEEGNRVTVEGIPRPISEGKVSALQLNKCLRNGF